MMNYDLLDMPGRSKRFMMESQTYRYFVGLIWLILGGKFSFQGFYRLHQYSESLRGSGLCVLYDPTPNLFECFEPITLGALGIALGFSVLKSKEHRPKLLLLYLSVFTIFLGLKLIPEGPFIYIFPFVLVLKMKLSFKECFLGIICSLGITILLWLYRIDLPTKDIIRVLLSEEIILSFFLVILSLFKYSSHRVSLFSLKISVRNRLFLLIYFIPWLATHLFRFFGLQQGSKFFF